MSTVSGTTRQTHEYQIYNPSCNQCSYSGCSCFHCSSATTHDSCGTGDWHSSDVGCCFSCPDKPVCSKVDVSVCTNAINNSGTPTAVFNNPANCSGSTSCPVKCTYDVKDVSKTLAQINDWEKSFGKTDDYNNVMKYFCGQIADTQCFPDQLNGDKPFSTCSKLKSIGDDGDRCRAWFANSATTDAIRDDFITYFCANNHAAGECKCAERASDSVYSKIKSSLPYARDGCWYVPCASVQTGSYLVPSTDAAKDCPTQICQTVWNNSGNSGTIIENGVQNYINCTQPPPSNPPGGSTPPPGGSTPPTGGSTPPGPKGKQLNPSKFTNTQKILISIGFGSIVLFLFLFCLFVFWKYYY